MSSCSDTDIDLKSCTYQKVKKIKAQILITRTYHISCMFNENVIVEIQFTTWWMKYLTLGEALCKLMQSLAGENILS